MIRIERTTIVNSDLLTTLPSDPLQWTARVIPEVRKLGPSCGHLSCRTCFRVCDFVRRCLEALRATNRVPAVSAIVLIEQFQGTSLAPGTPYITAAFKLADHAEDTAGGFEFDGDGNLPVGRDAPEPRLVIDHVVEALALFWGEADHR